MASTNKTTHYNLSQYVGTDKPTYLVDYNTDMSNIDTGIYNAQAQATLNENAIGDLSTLTTESKSSLVGAINEVDSHADANASAISNNTTDIATNTSAIGTLANLETTTKSNLVSAINELKGVNDTQTTNIAENTARIENFNLTSIENITTEVSHTGTGSISSVDITVAKNLDGSLAKIYGNISTTDYIGNVVIQTSLRPTSTVTVSNTCFRYRADNNTMGFLSLTIATDGKVTIQVASGSSTTVQVIPVLIFVKDFGDVPTPITI